jgi:hypothetical protein
VPELSVLSDDGVAFYASAALLRVHDSSGPSPELVLEITAFDERGERWGLVAYPTDELLSTGELSLPLSAEPLEVGSAVVQREARSVVFAEEGTVELTVRGDNVLGDARVVASDALAAHFEGKLTVVCLPPVDCTRFARGLPLPE